MQASFGLDSRIPQKGCLGEYKEMPGEIFHEPASRRESEIIEAWFYWIYIENDVWIKRDVPGITKAWTIVDPKNETMC